MTEKKELKLRTGDLVECYENSAWHHGVIARVDNNSYLVRYQIDNTEALGSFSKDEIKIIPLEFFENRDTIELMDVVAFAVKGYKNSLQGFCLGNTVKYIARAPYKGKTLDDLKKARWYLDHEIKRLEGVQDE